VYWVITIFYMAASRNTAPCSTARNCSGTCGIYVQLPYVADVVVPWDGFGSTAERRRRPEKSTPRTDLASMSLIGPGAVPSVSPRGQRMLLVCEPPEIDKVDVAVGGCVLCLQPASLIPYRPLLGQANARCFNLGNEVPQLEIGRADHLLEPAELRCLFL
jgi:hypothetical protein